MRRYNSNNTLTAYSISPREIQNSDRFGYKVIAVIHDDRYWCAYRMETHLDDSRWPDQGVEIPFEAASLLFPTLAHSSGREYYNP